MTTISEALSRGKKILRERINKNDSSTSIAPLYLRPSTRSCKQEKPYTVICPQSEHNRKSLLIDRNPLKMDQHFKVHQQKKLHNECPTDKFRVYRIIHPPAKRYKRCNHQDNVIVDRALLTEKEHLDMLAQPAKREMQPQFYKIIPKTIPPCTVRLHQLAQPTPQLLLSTWKQHAHHLAPSYIENFRKTLNASNFTTDTEQALHYIQQMKHDERQRRRYRRQEIRRLGRKIAKKQESEIRKVIRKIYGAAKEMFMNGQDYQLAEEATRMSEVVKKNLSKFIGYEQYRAETSTPQVLNKFLQNISDKLAYWATNFLQISGCHPEDFQIHEKQVFDSEQVDVEEPYEIEDYIEVLSNESLFEDETDVEEDPLLDKEIELETNDSEGEILSMPSDISSEIVLNSGTHNIDFELTQDQDLKEKPESIESKEVEAEHTDIETSVDDMEDVKATTHDPDLEADLLETRESATERMQEPEVTEQEIGNTEEQPQPKQKKSVRISEYIRKSVQKLEQLGERRSSYFQQSPDQPEDEDPPNNVDDENDNKK